MEINEENMEKKIDFTFFFLHDIHENGQQPDN